MIQEYSDFQCPFCSRVNPTVEQILAEDPKDVKIVWRNLPLPMHPDAPLAAEAAHEVFGQGGNKAFWKYHKVLFANQKALEQSDLERYAQALGNIDMTKIHRYGRARNELHAHHRRPLGPPTEERT